MNRIDLPKDKDSLVKAINAALSSSERERNPSAVEWFITSHWMQGVRRFRGLNYREGHVGQIAYEGPDGRLAFRYEIALEKMQVEMGRLNQLDLYPSVGKREHALESARKAAMGNAALAHAIPRERLEKILFDFKVSLLMFGCVGLAPHITAWPDGTPIHDIDIIPPWELGAMPSSSGAQGQEAAIVRDRWVPLSFARSLGLKLPDGPDSRALLEAIPAAYGGMVRGGGAMGRQAAAIESQLRNSSAAGPAGDTTSLHVRLVEVWMRGPEDTLARYIVKVGKLIPTDETYGDAKWRERNPDRPMPPPFPVGVAGYYHSGSFYSRSFLAPLVGINKEIEELLSSLFDNIKNMETQPTLTLSTSMNFNERKFRASKGPKILRYTPDAYSPERPVGSIAPVNPGPLPGQVAQLALSLLDRQAAQPPMMSGNAPGRVDSTPALNALWQMSHVPLDTVARSMATAIIAPYKAILYAEKVNLTAMDALEVALADENLAGIVIDKDSKKVQLGERDERTGQWRLGKNALPWPHEVDTGVKSTQPRDKEQEYQKLLQLRGQQMAQMTDAKFAYCVAKGDLPAPRGAFDRQVNTYQKALMSCLKMFADGQSPGEGFPFEAASDDVDIWLLTLESFMTQPVFSLADVDVQQTFVNKMRELEEAGGYRVPEGAPGLGQAAAEQGQLQQMMAQAQGAMAQGAPAGMGG